MLLQGVTCKVIVEVLSSVIMQADVVFDILQIINYGSYSSYHIHYGHGDLYLAALISLFVVPIVLAGAISGSIMAKFWSKKCGCVAACWDTSSFNKTLKSLVLCPFTFPLLITSLLGLLVLWAPLTILLCVPTVLCFYITPLAKFLLALAYGITR